MNKKIPVFLHIPKCAGTYVLGATMNLFRHYGISSGWRNELNWNLNLRRIHLQKEKKQIATLFIYDPRKTRLANVNFKPLSDNKHCDTVDLNDFLNEFKNKNLILFSAIIQDHGAKYIKQGLYKSLCETMGSVPYYYTLLRDPYERALSMYNYIIGSESIHEPTHDKVSCNTFTDYIKSSHLEDSWLIRALNGNLNAEEITKKEFNIACYMLDNFFVKDIKQVNELIHYVFLECYGITKNDFSKISLNINKNSTRKIFNTPFGDLDRKTRSQFLRRTEFDRKIYQRYC